MSAETKVLNSKKFKIRQHYSDYAELFGKDVAGDQSHPIEVELRYTTYGFPMLIHEREGKNDVEIGIGQALLIKKNHSESIRFLLEELEKGETMVFRLSGSSYGEVPYTFVPYVKPEGEYSDNFRIEPTSIYHALGLEIFGEWPLGPDAQILFDNLMKGKYKKVVNG